MFGKEHSAEENLKGIIPRAAADLFSRLEEASVTVIHDASGLDVVAGP